MHKYTPLSGKAGILLPALFSFLLLSACGKPLEKEYRMEDSLARMSSVASESGASVHALPFSYALALPGDTDFNTDNVKNAAAYLLVSDDGEAAPDAVAYANPYVRTYPASITKIMTALVCLDSGIDLDSSFTLTGSSAISEAGSSTAFLWPGETLRVRDLLYGMLLPSGNDAAVAVAEATSGSVAAFVGEMNRKALELGCTGTHFVNPHGLPDDAHFTTPYDIYLILSAAMKHEAFREIVGTREYTVNYKDRNGAAKSQHWENSNRYLNGEAETPAGLRILGGKTGTTKKAGYCLTQSAVRESTERRYIAVVMKADSKDRLYSDMTELLSKIP